MGLFALEPIQKGTVFLECGDLNVNNNGRPKVTLCQEGTRGHMMNDCAYHGSTLEYDFDENIAMNTNAGYLYPGSENKNLKCFLIAIKDIEEGEELSRHYGLDYWLKYEQKKYQLDELLPVDTYVFIDTIRLGRFTNYHRNFYGKRVIDPLHQEKYYYLVEDFCGRDPIDISKPDFSPYGFDEIIYFDDMTEQNLMRTRYLIQEYEKQIDIYCDNYEYKYFLFLCNIYQG